MAQSKNVKTTSSQIMELKDLISGPLVATIDADSISTQRYLSYLYELAFESYDRKTGKAGNIRMLTFAFKEQDTSGTRTKRVNIPLLSLVPLPLLQIKEADFDFEIQIVDAVSEDSNATFSLRNPRNEESSTPKKGETKLRVSLAPDSGSATRQSKSQQSLSANMKVKVTMQHADMPAGLSNLLNLASQGVVIENEDAADAEDAK